MAPELLISIKNGLLAQIAVIDKELNTQGKPKRTRAQKVQEEAKLDQFKKIQKKSSKI